MKILDSGLGKRRIAALLVALLAAPIGEAATAPPQPGVDAQQQSASPQQPDSSQSSPQPSQDSDAGSGKPNVDPLQPQQGAQPSSADSRGQSGNSQSNSEQQQNGGANPVGTAAAPYEKTTGVAASRPAGAVIAPAKQRRVRSFLIKFGVIVGAGVAIGTVAALSHSSPSQPH
jgi:hypothetical protein